ncbi:stage V sporulation protein AA [Piscibacillus halophilus]|uniref:Stage V sporulation protein AA n=1 Tax=Piscibacillus halophilus TaxID=571933 RepID=A0A1H9A0R2_9BACI|nr:stage V sporulation protein AA [Piscibacillus halophilus]SEP70322.1 stage V sporulation protein AA [Piscibacillus halophilus]
MAQVIYLRLKPKQVVKLGQQIYLKDIAWISTNNDEVKQKLSTLYLHTVTKDDQTYKVFDLFNIIERIHILYPEYEIESVGASQAILVIYQPKPKVYPIYVFFIWALLFVGAAMAIMNFHFDVSMEEVQSTLHRMISADEEGRSVLWLQVPYSIGLGLGMILFFNHFFKKRFNEEPSPLEVEMFNYDQDLHHYVSFNENELNKNDDD